MNAHRTPSRILLAFALAMGIAACSSGSPGSSSGASSSPSPAGSPSAPATSASPVSSSGTTGTIAADWTAFFSPKTPVNKRISLLQDGQTFASVIKSQPARAWPPRPR